MWTEQESNNMSDKTIKGLQLGDIIVTNWQSLDVLFDLSPIIEESFIKWKYLRITNLLTPADDGVKSSCLVKDAWKMIHHLWLWRRRSRRRSSILAFRGDLCHLDIQVSRNLSWNTEGQRKFENKVVRKKEEDSGKMEGSRKQEQSEEEEPSERAVLPVETMYIYWPWL